MAHIDRDQFTNKDNQHTEQICKILQKSELNRSDDDLTELAEMMSKIKFFSELKKNH